MVTVTADHNLGFAEIEFVENRHVAMDIIDVGTVDGTADLQLHHIPHVALLFHLPLQLSASCGGQNEVGGATQFNDTVWVRRRII